MKRQFILTLVLLAVTLLAGIACEYGSLQAARTYQNEMLSVALALTEENWDDALLNTENIYADWQKHSRIVQLWVNHKDIDDVTTGLIDLRAALLSRDFSAALAACGQCVENFGHLHHRDAFTLRNIL